MLLSIKINIYIFAHTILLWKLVLLIQDVISKLVNQCIIYYFYFGFLGGRRWSGGRGCWCCWWRWWCWCCSSLPFLRRTLTWMGKNKTGPNRLCPLLIAACGQPGCLLGQLSSPSSGPQWPTTSRCRPRDSGLSQVWPGWLHRCPSRRCSCSLNKKIFF